MNLDHILATFNERQVAYLLIGGMNFLLRHSPVLTYDVDLWIEDTVENRQRCELALADLACEWGATDEDWGPVSEKRSGWLQRQSLYCLTSPSGAIDIFRRVAGLDNWQRSFADSVVETTAGRVYYRGISDEDMLRCQYALSEQDRKRDRIEFLEKIRQEPTGNGV